MTYQHLSMNLYESPFMSNGGGGETLTTTSATTAYTSLTPNLTRRKVLPCIRQIMSVVPSRRRLNHPGDYGQELGFINHESSNSSLDGDLNEAISCPLQRDYIRRGRNFKQYASPLVSLRRKLKNFTTANNNLEPHKRPLFSSIFDQNYISEKLQNCYLAGESSEDDENLSNDEESIQNTTQMVTNNSSSSGHERDLEIINIASRAYLKKFEDGNDGELKSYSTEGITEVTLRKEYPQEKYGLKLEKTTYNTTFITMVLPESIAEKSGLSIGDRIVRINNVHTSEMTLLQITEEIRLANHSVSISYQPRTFLHTAVLHKEKGKLGIRLREHLSNLWIDIVLPFSPAEKSGLKKGQRLISLNSNNVIGWTHKQAIDWLRKYPDNFDLILLVQDTNESLIKQDSTMMMTNYCNNPEITR